MEPYAFGPLRESCALRKRLLLAYEGADAGSGVMTVDKATGKIINYHDLADGLPPLYGIVSPEGAAILFHDASYNERLKRSADFYRLMRVGSWSVCDQEFTGTYNPVGFVEEKKFVSVSPDTVVAWTLKAGSWVSQEVFALEPGEMGQKRVIGSGRH